jgi:lysophospholipase L1-like esterase
VYNFGVPGAGPRDYLAVIRQDVWRFAPDLVLVSFLTSDDATEHLPRPRYLDPRQHALYRLARGWLGGPPQGFLMGQTGGAPDRLSRPALSEEVFREVEARRLTVFLSPPPPAVEKKWQRTFADLARIADECRRHGVPAALVLIPDEFQVNPAVLATALGDRGLDRGELDLELPQRRLRKFCADSGVACLDLLPAFAGVPEVYAPHDTHWNARGNRLAAERIAEWLRPLCGK